MESDDGTVLVGRIGGTEVPPEDSMFTRQGENNVRISRGGLNNSETIGGDSSSGWKNNWGWDASNLDPCRDGWFGITCDSSDQISAIRLPRNDWSGIFPFREVVFLASSGSFSISGVGNLTALEIYNNRYLTNEEERDYWLSSMDGLEVLNYRYTSFRGQIPRLPTT